MLKIWGRANSVNVQKAVWAAAETGVAFERVDAGMAFGKNNEDWYLCLLYTSPSPRDALTSRMPSSA